MITAFSASIPPLPPPTNVVIVGGSGKVGKAFSTLLPSAILVNRNQNLNKIILNSPKDTPILVCTTNDALSKVISATPASRRCDLIFLQNGMLLPELCTWDLENTSTQVLLYLAATSSGTFNDGKQTACIRKWAEWFSHDVLQKNRLECRVISNFEEYKVLMVHKLLWACIFWMMSAALGGVSVGEIVENNGKQVAELVEELAPLASDVLFDGDNEATVLDSKLALEALIAYSMRIPDAVPSKEMALKEFRWRNGWFLAHQQKEFLLCCDNNETEFSKGQTLHIEWLRRAGCNNLMSRSVN
jgi:hypothetical protein